MILDSTFLVDLEREARVKRPGPAMDFLGKHPEEVLCVTFTVAGEMAAGKTLQDYGRWEKFLSPFRFLGNRTEVNWLYGQIYRNLSVRGCLIGSNDMWIAATALSYQETVITRNLEDFSRVTGLRVLGY